MDIIRDSVMAVWRCSLVQWAENDKWYNLALLFTPDTFYLSTRSASNLLHEELTFLASIESYSNLRLLKICKCENNVNHCEPLSTEENQYIYFTSESLGAPYFGVLVCCVLKP